MQIYSCVPGMGSKRVLHAKVCYGWYRQHIDLGLNIATTLRHALLLLMLVLDRLMFEYFVVYSISYRVWLAWWVCPMGNAN